MRSESETQFDDKPFSSPVAERLKRLPPYMFGKINKLKLPVNSNSRTIPPRLSNFLRTRSKRPSR